MDKLEELLMEAVDLSHSDLQRRLSKALKARFGAGEDTWAVDVFDDHLVYRQGEKLLQLDYTVDDEGAVTVGEPFEVMSRTVYEPVAESLRGADRRTVLERVTLLKESQFIDEDGTIKLQVIRAGFGNKRDNHYYPAKTLERDHPIFAGRKMYCDHPTSLEEKQRPERSLRDWVATIKETWVDKGIVWARARVHASWFRDLIAEAGDEIGISINALGDVNPGEIGGRRCGVVESIVGCNSVDFVTQAGAGGRVAALYESARKEDASMFTTMSDEEILAGLRESRGSVFAKLRDEIKGEMEADRHDDRERLEEGKSVKDDGLTLLQEANRRAGEIIEGLERKVSAMTTREAVAEALSKTTLPAACQERIREAFADKAFDSEATRTEAIEAAIKAERDYAVRLTESGRVTGLGDGQAEADAQERLVESYKAMGLSDEQAAIAAKGR